MATPSAFGTSPKYDIESLNVNKALVCRIWGRTGGGASLRELQSATGEGLRLRTLLPSVLDRVSSRIMSEEKCVAMRQRKNNLFL
jgi:hypothetical protein